MKNILVIGSANADFSIHTNQMPKLGETIIGNNFSLTAGGKGLNQAVTIAKLGGNVTFIGSVGCDTNGEMLIETLNQYDVSFEGIKTEDSTTGIALITVVDGDNFIILNSGANNLLTSKVVEEKTDLIAEADCVVLQLEIPIETVIKIAEIAKENNTKVILNPAPYKELPDEIFPLVDILIPNEHEAGELTGINLSNEKNCISAINILKEKGTKTVIITLGDRGCVYNNCNEIVFCPAEKANVVDTTSAGDSFIGALCLKLVTGVELSDAIKFATKVSAITVSRKGAAISVPSISEIDF